MAKRYIFKVFNFINKQGNVNKYHIKIALHVAAMVKIKRKYQILPRYQ